MNAHTFTYRVLFLFAIGLQVSVTAARAQEILQQRWTFTSESHARAWGTIHDGRILGVERDVLRVEMTGIDTFLESPTFSMPLDGVIVRVRMRCDRDGVTQLYWRTNDMPAFTQSVTDGGFTKAPPAGEFTTVEYRIGKMKDAGKTLVQIRVDPFNDNTSGVVEIQSIEIVRLAPVLDLRLATAREQVDVGEAVPLRVAIRQVDGMVVREPMRVSVGEERDARVHVMPASQPADIETLAFTQPGVNFVRARVETSAGAPVAALRSAVVVGREDRLPLVPGLRSERMRLDFVRVASGEPGQVGAARWSLRDARGEWRTAGWLMPLGALVSPGEKDEAIQEIVTSARLSVRGRFAACDAEVAGQPMRVTFHLTERAGREVIDVAAELKPENNLQLLAFSPPALRLTQGEAHDPLDRFALLGGIEFLEPGWPSSGERGMGTMFRDRWSLWPHKIAMPVMAVEAAGLTTAMMWDPVQPGAANDSLVAPTFSSPDHLEGQSCHLMELRVPGGKPYAAENTAHAQRPVTVRAKQALTLAYTLHGEPELPLAMVSRRYYELFPPPAIATPPHDDRGLYDLLARNAGETMYTQGRGWTMHWFFPEDPRPIGRFAAQIVAHRVDTGEPRYANAANLTGTGIIEASGSLVHQLGLEASARASAGAMRVDGTFAFRNSEQMRRQAREFTRGQYDSLGEDDSTSLGTCVQAALPMLRYTLLSGDDTFVPACVKTLEAMRRFRVPRGAQVWEVHQEIPDIRAAALAVEAYRMGAAITGDARYLDDAYYWAWTGAPFIYSWHVPLEEQVPSSLASSRDRNKPSNIPIPLDEAFQRPRRRVTPYATIPVLGPTFYVINWFGVPVQWCGLEWAEKVLDLLDERPDPLLKALADGVVSSGLEQMFDRPPWVGTYPDSWDLEFNRAQGALLSSALITDCLQAQRRVPLWTGPWTRVIQGESSQIRWHVSGWGPVPTLDPPPAQPVTWRVELQYPPGQLNELLIARAERPKRVTVGMEVIPLLESPPASLVPGWYYDAVRRLTVVRFVQRSEKSTLTLHW